MATNQTATSEENSAYRNPWYKPGHGEEFYRTSAKPVQIGKYTRYHRIQSRNPSANCYDFVLKGVCFAQRCGPATEAQIDACEYARDNLRKIFGVRS